MSDRPRGREFGAGGGENLRGGIFLAGDDGGKKRGEVGRVGRGGRAIWLLIF